MKLISSARNWGKIISISNLLQIIQFDFSIFTQKYYKLLNKIFLILLHFYYTRYKSINNKIQYYRESLWFYRSWYWHDVTIEKHQLHQHAFQSFRKEFISLLIDSMEEKLVPINAQRKQERLRYLDKIGPLKVWWQTNNKICKYLLRLFYQDRSYHNYSFSTNI